MHVSIDDIQTLVSKNVSGLKLIPISSIIYRPHGEPAKKIWGSEHEIPKDKVSEFSDIGVKEINLLYTTLLYNSLCNYCPESFRLPSALKTFYEIDKIINTYDRINKISKRKRSISLLFELYNHEGKRYNPVLQYNEPIDFQKWNSVKKRIRKDAKIPILYNEIGIIVFVDLMKKGNDYINRFQKNADLCSLVAQRKGDYTDFNFSPDFNTMTDIWTVNDPVRLLETYINNKVRLIIIGDKVNEAYKAELLKVKKYDRYARFMVATNINPAHCKPLLMGIKKAYNTNNYDIE